jgi:hypothetical protein
LEAPRPVVGCDEGLVRVPTEDGHQSGSSALGCEVVRARAVKGVAIGSKCATDLSNGSGCEQRLQAGRGARLPLLTLCGPARLATVAASTSSRCTTAGTLSTYRHSPPKLLLKGTRRNVEFVQERWRIDEGWWTPNPVSRIYYSLILAQTGALVTIYQVLLPNDTWWTQRA